MYMNLFDSKKTKNEIMNEYRLSLEDYSKLKLKVIELSFYLGYENDLSNKKRLSKRVRKVCSDFDVPKQFQPVFVSNLFMPNEKEILQLIEEAVSFGCKLQDAPLYISLNHNISKELVELKLAEIETYKEFYHEHTRETIEKVIQKVA